MFSVFLSCYLFLLPVTDRMFVRLHRLYSWTVSHVNMWLNAMNKLDIISGVYRGVSGELFTDCGLASISSFGLFWLFFSFENGRLFAMDCPLVFSYHCCRFKAGLHPGRVASLLHCTVACVWTARRSQITWTEPTRTQGERWTPHRKIRVELEPVTSLLWAAGRCSSEEPVHGLHCT